MTRAFGLTLCVALIAATGCEAVLGLKHTDQALEARAGAGGGSGASQKSAGGAAGERGAGGPNVTPGTGGSGAGGAVGGRGDAGNAPSAGGVGGSGPETNGGQPGGGHAGASGGSGGSESNGGKADAGSGGEAGNGDGGAGDAGAAGLAGAGNGGGAGTGETVVPFGAIVGVDGSCVAVAETNGHSVVDGHAVHRACANDPAESWSRDADDHLRAAVLDAYLTVDGDTTELGEALHVAAANSPATADQQWSLVDIQFKNAAGLCIDVVNAVYEDAAVLQVFHCNLADNQNWSVTSLGQIQHGDYCFDIPHGVLDDRTPLEIYPCGSDSPNQRFVLEHGQIEPRGSTKCIGIAGDPAVENATLEVQSCDPTGALGLGQSFRITGPITSQDQCLDIGTSGVAGPVMLKPCTGAAEQVWSWKF